MASRRRKNPNDKESEFSHQESPLKLTRREVAKRELLAAIREHFNEGDPIVIHLLASAARDICAPVIKASGKQTFAELLEQIVKPEYRRALRESVREPYNFFKHGGADPEKELRYFDPTANDMLLLQVCSDYRSAFNVDEKEMLVFLAWHMVSYPDVLTDHGWEMLKTVSKGFEGLDAEGRLVRGRQVLDALKDGVI